MLDLLHLTIVPIVNDAPMLAKATVRLDAVSRSALLKSDFIVYSTESISNEGDVPNPEALIEANFRNI